MVSNFDENRGLRFQEIIEKVFAGESNRDFGKRIGTSEANVRNWKKGKAISIDFLISMHTAGVDIGYLLTGSYTKNIPPNAAILNTPNTAYSGDELKIIGRAAADNEQCSSALIFQPEETEQLEGYSIPETAQLVRIIGNSMEPVVLHRQLVMIDMELPPNKPLVKRGIYVAHIMDGAKEGYYCKRATVDYLNDCNIIFTSVNHAECRTDRTVDAVARLPWGRVTNL